MPPTLRTDHKVKLIGPWGGMLMTSPRRIRSSPPMHTRTLTPSGPCRSVPPHNPHIASTQAPSHRGSGTILVRGVLFFIMSVIRWVLPEIRPIAGVSPLASDKTRLAPMVQEIRTSLGGRWSTGLIPKLIYSSAAQGQMWLEGTLYPG
jgi:hypothetical protein